MKEVNPTFVVHCHNYVLSKKTDKILKPEGGTDVNCVNIEVRHSLVEITDLKWLTSVLFRISLSNIFS